MEYNAKRDALIVREYGRSVQKMVNYVKRIEDAELRQAAAEAVVETMGVLNPRLKDLENFQQRLWDHFFLIAGYDIEVNSPYPKPEQADSQALAPLKYPGRAIKFKHLGGNLETLIARTIAENDNTSREALMHMIIQAMRQLYINRYKESLSDEELRKELKAMSCGALVYSRNPIYAVFTKLPKEQRGEKQPSIKERKKSGGRHRFGHARKKR